MKVCVRWINHSGLLIEFPKEEKQQVNGNADVGRNEIVAVPWLENMEAIEDDDHDKESEREIGSVRLEG